MEPLTATSLDDLADVLVDVAISRPDGRTVLVPMRALPESECFALRLAITWPQPPVSNVVKTEGQVRPVYNYNDDGYLAATREANRKLSFLVLLHSLRVPIPGADEAERLATLQARLGNFAYMQLVTASNKLNLVTEEDLAAMANSFRAGGAAGAALGYAAAPDAGPVVVAAEE